MSNNNLNLSDKFNDIDLLDDVDSLDLSMDVPQSLKGIFLDDGLLDFDDLLTLDLTPLEAEGSSEDLGVVKEFLRLSNTKTVDTIIDSILAKSSEVRIAHAVNTSPLFIILQDLYANKIITADSSKEQILQSVRIKVASDVVLPETMDTFGASSDELTQIEQFKKQVDNAMLVLSSKRDNRSTANTSQNALIAKRIQSEYADFTNVDDITDLLSAVQIVKKIDYLSNHKALVYKVTCQCGNTFEVDSLGECHSGASLLIPKFKCNACNTISAYNKDTLLQISTNAQAIHGERRKRSYHSVSRESLREAYFQGCMHFTMLEDDATEVETNSLRHVEVYKARVAAMDKDLLFQQHPDRFFTSLLSTMLDLNGITIDDVVATLKATVYHSNMFAIMSKSKEYAIKSLTSLCDRLDELRQEEFAYERLRAVIGDENEMLSLISMLLGKKVSARDVMTLNRKTSDNVFDTLSTTRLRTLIAKAASDTISFTEEEKRKSLDKFLSNVYFLQRSAYDEDELYATFPFLDEYILKYIQRFTIIETAELLSSAYKDARRVRDSWNKIRKGKVDTVTVPVIRDVIEANMHLSLNDSAVAGLRGISLTPDNFNEAYALLRELQPRMLRGYEDLDDYNRQPELIDFLRQMQRILIGNATQSYLTLQCMEQCIALRQAHMFQVYSYTLSMPNYTLESEVASRTANKDRMSQTYYALFHYLSNTEAPMSPLMFGAIHDQISIDVNGEVLEFASIEDFFSKNVADPALGLSDHIYASYMLGSAEMRSLLIAVAPELNAPSKLVKSGELYFYGDIAIDSYAKLLEVYRATQDSELYRLLESDVWA